MRKPVDLTIIGRPCNFAPSLSIKMIDALRTSLRKVNLTLDEQLTTLEVDFLTSDDRK
jgi:hypothetical protein